MFEKNTVSAMLRETVENSAEFFNKIADHIEKLENQVQELIQKINQLEAEQDDHK